MANAQNGDAHPAGYDDASERKTRRRIALRSFQKQSDGSVQIPIGYAVKGMFEREKIRRFPHHRFDNCVWYDSEMGNREVPKTYKYSIHRAVYSPEELVTKQRFPELAGLFSDPFVVDGRVYVKTWSAGKFASLVKKRSDVIRDVEVVDDQTCIIPGTKIKICHMFCLRGALCRRAGPRAHNRP